MSTISLNRGKYPSHFQVCNAVRIIHISPLVHAYDIANAVACTGRLPTNVSLFTSPTNVSDIGLNRGKYLSYYQVWNAVRIIHIGPLVHAYDMANAVAATYQRVWYAPYYSLHLPTCLISVWIGGNVLLIIRYGTLSEWVHTYDMTNAVACTGRPPTNVSDMLPAIHVTY